MSTSGQLLILLTIDRKVFLHFICEPGHMLLIFRTYESRLKDNQTGRRGENLSKTIVLPKLKYCLDSGLRNLSIKYSVCAFHLPLTLMSPSHFLIIFLLHESFWPWNFMGLMVRIEHISPLLCSGWLWLSSSTLKKWWMNHERWFWN